MYNVGFMTMNNLQVPDDGAEDAATPETTQGRGLLARAMKPKSSASKSDEPRDRVARYVSQIRKARMGLKNG